MINFERGERMSLTFYWYPKCGTCRNAKKWLDSHQLQYEAIDLVEAPPSERKLKFYTKIATLS